MKKQNLLFGYLAISIAMLFWGISFVWTKQLLIAGFPVFTIVFFRLIVSSAFLFSFFKWQDKLEKIRTGDWKWFFLLSLFEPFLYFIGEDFGLKYVDASFAAVIIALIPIAVTFTMHFVEKEPLHWKMLLGIVVSVFGVGLMSIGPDNTFSFSSKGFLLLMLAVASASGYSVLLARLLKHYGPVSITTYQNMISILYYLPFVCVFDMRHFSSLTWNFSTVGSLLCLAILCSSGAYVLYSYAAKEISISKVSVFTNAIPIVTILFASMMGQETCSVQKIIGIVVVVGGVVFSQFRPIRHKEIDNVLE